MLRLLQLELNLANVYVGLPVHPTIPAITLHRAGRKKRSNSYVPRIPELKTNPVAFLNNSFNCSTATFASLWVSNRIST